MSLNLYESSGDEAGIFNILGKAFAAIESLNTARLTTVPDKVKAYIDRFKLATVTLEGDKSLDSVAVASTSWAAGGSTITQSLANSLAAFIRAAVMDDDPAATGTLADTLERIIAAMVAGEFYVDDNTITLTVWAFGSNLSDIGICCTQYDSEEVQQENILAEEVMITCRPGAAGSAALTFTGATAVQDRTRETWPAGSGARTTLTTGAGNLLLNGDFETASTSTTNMPANWTLALGTPGSNIALTSLEVQTVVMSGTPTAGSYWLTWDNGTHVHSSTELPYNATQSQVQAALRKIPGLGAVTVVTTGTTPNLTHTITMVGAPGNPAQLTSIDATTGGTHTLTHATTTAGPAGAYLGKALKFTGVVTGAAAEVQLLDTFNASTGTVTLEKNGGGGSFVIDISLGVPSITGTIESNLESTWYPGRSVTVAHLGSGQYQITFGDNLVTALGTVTDSSTNGTDPATLTRTTTGTPGTPVNVRIFQPVTLTPGTVYFVAFRAYADAAIAAGNLIVELIDGATGAAIGSLNEKTTACTSIGTAAHSFIYHRLAIPETQVEQVYLRFRCESLTATKSVYVDDVYLVPATQLYPGGPYVAGIPGREIASLGDRWTITSTNDRAGELQEWFNRVFRMADLGLLLPTTGANLIPDSIIA